MPIGVPAQLPIEPAGSGDRGFQQLNHGDLLSARVTRTSADGSASVRLGQISANARSDGLLQTGQRVFAYVQKNQDETLLALLPRAKEGDILTGSVARNTASGALVRFDDLELNVRLSSSDSAPEPGTQIRAQLQLRADKPVLQALPAGGSESVLTGVVTGQRPDGSTLIEIEGTPFIATTDAPVAVGEAVHAKLIYSLDKMLLHIMQNITHSQAALSASEEALLAGFDNFLSVLGSDFSSAQLLEALFSGQLKLDGFGRELLALLQQVLTQPEPPAWASNLSAALETILLNPQEGNLADRLASALVNSGVFLESRMLEAALAGEGDASISGDLKLALLQASEKLSQAGRPGGAAAALAPQMSDVAARVGGLLDAVTGEQMQNVRMLAANEIYLQLPFAESAGLERLEIRISHQGERAAQKIDAKNVLVTLAVDTSQLGRIKAALSIVNGQISCRFKAETEEAVKLVTENADLLKRGIERFDYRVANIECSLSRDPSELAVLDDLSTDSQKGLDVRA